MNVWTWAVRRRAATAWVALTAALATVVAPAVASAEVSVKLSAVGQALGIRIRGKDVAAQVVALPFLRPGR